MLMVSPTGLMDTKKTNALKLRIQPLATPMVGNVNVMMMTMVTMIATAMERIIPATIIQTKGKGVFVTTLK